MLSSVLRTDISTKMSVKIIRAFVYMRKYISNDLIRNNDILVNHENRILKLEESFNKLSSKQNSIIFEDKIYDAYSILLDIFNNAKKEIIEHEAVSKILDGILDGKEIENLFLEFDSHRTKEAMFAYMCDKLECDLQCKLYDEEGCVDLYKQDGNNALNNKIVHELLASGASWSEM